MSPLYFNFKQVRNLKKLACRTIRDLVYAQICYVRYIFKFSNRYRVTSKINELYQGRVAVISLCFAWRTRIRLFSNPKNSKLSVV